MRGEGKKTLNEMVCKLGKIEITALVTLNGVQTTQRLHLYLARVGGV